MSKKSFFYQVSLGLIFSLQAIPKNKCSFFDFVLSEQSLQHAELKNIQGADKTNRLLILDKLKSIKSEDLPTKNFQGQSIPVPFQLSDQGQKAFVFPRGQKLKVVIDNGLWEAAQFFSRLNDLELDKFLRNRKIAVEGGKQFKLRPPLLKFPRIKESAQKKSSSQFYLTEANAQLFNDLEEDTSNSRPFEDLSGLDVENLAQTEEGASPDSQESKRRASDLSAVDVAALSSEEIEADQNQDGQGSWCVAQ